MPADDAEPNVLQLPQLPREGWLVKHKKTHRIYCLEGLNVRSKRRWRHVTVRHRRIRLAVNAVDQCWSMDFVSNNLFNGRRISALTVVDNFSRECVEIEVDQDFAVMMWSP